MEDAHDERPLRPPATCVVIRLEMFVQVTQTQVKHDTYLAWLYINVSLISSDTVTLPPSTEKLSESNRSLYKHFNPSNKRMRIWSDIQKGSEECW